MHCALRACRAPAQGRLTYLAQAHCSQTTSALAAQSFGVAVVGRWPRHRFRLTRRQISHRQISLRTGKISTNFSPLIRRHTHPRNAHSREIFLPSATRSRARAGRDHARFALFVMGVGWSPPSRFFSPSGLSGWWSRLGGDPCSVSDVRRRSLLQQRNGHVHGARARHQTRVAMGLGRG